VTGDVLDEEALERALDRVEVAYYLIHSMERRAAGDTRGGNAHPRPAEATPGFPERERLAAEGFVRVARRARVSRVIYLGGLVPHAWRASRHLASRMAVERILLKATPDSLALRASIVIGARSRSFRLLVRLVERLPVLALPPWHRYRTQPIDERDLIAMLVRAARLEAPGARSIDVAGPDVLSYGAMVERIAELMVIGRPALRLGHDLGTMSARIVAAITQEDPELTTALMEALKGDLLPGAPAELASERFGVALHSFDAAVEHALRDWEELETLAAR
jgi:uncharacterized protein YbjT (DUF2867 family)